jgi:hypothetical protein
MKEKAKYFLYIALLVCFYFILVATWTPVYSQGANNQVQQQTSLINCMNPAGCVGKLKLDWPACPICNTPLSPSSVKSKRGGNIAEDIVTLLEKAHSLDEDIGKIKIKREKDFQDKMANAKTFDAFYADKVYDNLQKLVDAYERTKIHLERGGEDVEGSLVSSFVGGRPVWKKKSDFIVYPKPRR